MFGSFDDLFCSTSSFLSHFPLLLLPRLFTQPTKQLAWAVYLGSRPVALHFLPEMSACFAATVAGRLALVASTDGDVEEIGRVAAGIAAAAVGRSGGSSAASSIAAAVAQGDCGLGDGSAIALALVTAAGRLLVLSLPTWEALADEELFQKDPVPVPAREVATEVFPPKKLYGEFDEDDDDEEGKDSSPRFRLTPEDVSISWRGDGAAFATVSRTGVGEEKSPFVVRTWDAASLLGDAEGAPPPPPTSATFLGASGVAGGIGIKGMRGANGSLASSTGGSAQPRNHRRLLTAVGERVEGLSRASAWQPNGRHLFVAVEEEKEEGEKGKRYSVALFERNGLGHGRFGPLTATTATTSSSSSRVAALCWSPDSELIAVSLVEEASESTTVQLWRRSNWHWYLQAELRDNRSGSGSSSVAVAFADGAAPGTARLCLASSSISSSTSSSTTKISVRTIDYVLDLAAQSPRGTVAVVDGGAALVTSLAREVVPPPLCSAPVVVGGGGRGDSNSGGAAAAGAISCLALGEASSSSNSGRQSSSFEILAALRSDNRLFLARALRADDWASALEDATEGGADEVAALAGDDAEGRPPAMPAADSGLVLPRHWGAVRSLAFAGTSGVLLAVVSGSGSSEEAEGLGGAGKSEEKGGGDFLVPISFDAEALTARLSEQQQQHRMPSPVLVAADAGGDSVLVQLEGGELLLWSAASGGLISEKASSSPLLSRFPAPCPWMRPIPRDAVAEGAAPSSSSLPLALGLTLAGELCLGPAVVARGVTSAALRRGSSSSSGGDRGASSVSAAAATPPPNETFVLFATADDVLHSAPLSLLLAASAAGGGGEDGGHGNGLPSSALGKQQPQQDDFHRRSAASTHLTAAIRTGVMASDMRAAMRGSGVGSTAAGDVSSRAVELGSRLVVAPPAAVREEEEEGDGDGGDDDNDSSRTLWDGCRVVLQMPRGNLETVVPRSLALESVAASLALGLGGSKNESEGAKGAEVEKSSTKPQRLAALRRAWLCAVANRLDANLVVDYAWPRFLARAGEFVEALGDDAALADLLCALRPESTLMPAARRRGMGGKGSRDGDGGGGGAYSWIPLALQTSHGGAAGAFADDGDQSAGEKDDEGEEEEAAAKKVAKQDKVRRVAAALRDALKRATENSSSSSSSESSFLKPILTSYAVLGDLQSALAAVRRARERELAQGKEEEEENEKQQRQQLLSAASTVNNPSPLGLGRRAAARSSSSTATTTADEGIRHLLLTVPFEALYRAALRLHDVQLAHLVVLSAGRDPGEHLPQLRALASAGRSGSPMRAYAIERHLGRPRAALRALLVAAGVVMAVEGEEGEEGDGKTTTTKTTKVEFSRPLFDEALALARSAGLTRELVAALKTAAAAPPRCPSPSPSPSSSSSSSSSPSPFAEVQVLALRAHAHALVARGKAEDAALALLAAGDRKSAVSAYASAGAWQPALALASGIGGGQPSFSSEQPPWPRRKIEALASDLADALAQEGRLPEAAEVSLTWLRDDAERAVGWLATAGQWRRALAAAASAERPDLAETTLAPLAAEAASTTLRSAREDARRAVTYLARYKEVQSKRRAMEAAVAEAEANRRDSDADEDFERQNDFDDAASDASGVSGLSAYTSTSTVTQRNGSSSSSDSSSSIAASTVGGRAGRWSGGRRAETKRSKAERRGRRRALRAGGEHEEEGLATLLLSLKPSDDALSSAGQLAELLVMLGHEQDAAALQVALAELVSSSSAATDFVSSNPPKVVESEAEQRKREKEESKKKKKNTAAAPQWKWDLLRPMAMTATEAAALDSDEDDFGAFGGLGHGSRKRGEEEKKKQEEEGDGGLFS